MTKNKGGRKSALDENIRALVMDKSWYEIYQYLIDPKIDRADKVKAAIVLASKSIPQEVKSDIKVSGISLTFPDGTKIAL